MKDKWIWLPENRYPEYQKNRYDTHYGADESGYVVAEFKREYVFEKEIEKVNLRFSGDTEFQLFCNGKLVATGPASVGGDFLGNGAPREWYYATQTEIYPSDSYLNFFARVKAMPVHMCEFSKGRGGFTLSGEIFFSDGSRENISSDSKWLVRRNGAFVSPFVYEGSITADKYINAQEIDDIWHATTAPIPPREEKEIFTTKIDLLPYEEKKVEIEFDRIYAGFASLKTTTAKSVSAEIKFFELDGDTHFSSEKISLSGSNASYRGFYLHSAGKAVIEIKNNSAETAQVVFGFISTCYPVLQEAQTVTSDDELNDLLGICKHTLKYCRQTHHLDSPRHCEPLACTGDYYIETLMTVFSFGDLRLSTFDILRTAELLRHNDGRIFHTTYSLIWVKMLYDVYTFVGDSALLTQTEDALEMLLNRFERYIGETGLIENPPDYMFVDWIYIDEISMHHPPKCLGQTVLNMFYYCALDNAVKIYAALNRQEQCEYYAKKKEELRRAINEYLYDKENGMYFEGLNTPSLEENLGTYHPQNIDKRYYLKHSNVMAVYSGVCDEEKARELVEKIMSDEIRGDVQPYFLHYLLEGVYACGLRDKYTLKILGKWKQSVKENPKGLVEGFIPPEPTYRFDHSHAWGGTPLWSLPKALLGLKVTGVGFKEIFLSPSLLGLNFAKVELPTPYGIVTCILEKDKPIVVNAPKEIKVSYN